MSVSGIEIRGFAGIGSDPVVLSPIRKMNMLVGANCTGKSSILRALAYIKSQPGMVMPPNEVHRLDPRQSIPFKITLYVDLKDNRELMRWLEVHESRPKIEMTFVSQKGMPPTYPLKVEEEMRHNDNLRRELLGLLGSRTLGDDLLGITRGKYQLKDIVGEVVFIGNNRRVTSDSGAATTPSGSGMVGEIDRGRNPDSPTSPDTGLYEKLSPSMQAAFGLDRDPLIVPSVKKTELNVKQHGLHLPLSSHGDGLEQYLVLQRDFLKYRKCWVCVEDPELHLHAKLQRDLMDFMLSRTDNTYFVSSHSSVFMEPSEDVQVFRVYQVDGTTRVEPVLNKKTAVTALDDLGVRASSLLQSDYVVWVEGPSDRYYIRKWLQLADPRLLEHRHYSFLFLGGTTKSEVCFDPDDPDALANAIDAMATCRKAAVVLDSDIGNPQVSQDDIERVKAQCASSGLLCWVTQGRTIEHYLPRPVLFKYFLGGGAAPGAEIPNLTNNQTLEEWVKALPHNSGGGKRYKKTRDSRRIAEMLDKSSLDDTELKERVQALAKSIAEANGM
jgi:hypothetical protein